MCVGARPVRCSVYRWEVKVSFAVLLLQYFLLVAFFAFLPFSVERCPFWNRHETSCNVSTPFLAVLACFKDRSSCSCVSSEGPDELACDGSAMGNGARNSLLFGLFESLFAFLFSFFVLALTFRCPTRLRPHLHRQSVTDRQS